MRRALLLAFVLLLISAATLSAQFRWKCDPKDGKFIVTLCTGCKKFYCWDGEIFSAEDGYTSPPGYVLSYWEEVHRKSQQIRADLDRRGKELKEQVEKGRQETARLNRERAQTHKEFMDDLNRRIAASRSSTGAIAAPRASVAAIQQRATPKDVVVDAPAAAMPAPAIPPTRRAKVSEVQVGMSRSAVENVLGKPHSAVSIPDDEGLVEILTYLLEDRCTARVRIVQGKVVSVKISD